ncbi:MAG: PTS glucose transporter subunit IIA, partial [Streptococcaceae bacterium]|jgi:PTS system beta-glucosides-specific IIC component|nr:PTS glucose transporter subunit IIA [Streptococcaceae bacterium]
MGALGIFALPNFISPDGDASGALIFLGSIILATIVAYLFTLLFYKEEANVESTSSTLLSKPYGVLKDSTVYSPLSGEVLPLEEAQDAAFSEGALGQGVMILPNENIVYAPFDGKVKMIFPTKHAIGLEDEAGVEVLIHVGIDTVELQGEGFSTNLKVGDTVKKGQEILRFDKEFIQASGFSLQTPIVVTNSNDFTDVLELKKGEIIANEALLTVTA